MIQLLLRPFVGWVNCRRLDVIVCSSLLSVSGIAMAEVPHFPRNDEIRNVRAISGAQISPDGTHVLTAITDTTADGGRSHLYVLNRDGSRYQKLAPLPGKPDTSESQGTWSPDGESIFYICNTGKEAHLCKAQVGTHRVKELPGIYRTRAGLALGTNGTRTPVEQFSLSPDGKTLAVVTKDPDDFGKPAGLPAKADAHLEGSWVSRSRLYLIDAADGGAPIEVPLTRDPGKLAWSPDSASLLAITHDQHAELGPSAEAWLVARRFPAAVNQLVDIPERLEDVTWGEEGRTIIYVVGGENVESPENIVVRNTDGTSHQFDGKGGDLTDNHPFFIDHDGSLVTIHQRGFRKIVTLLNPETGQETTQDIGFPAALWASATPNGKSWAYLAGGPTTAGTILITGPDGHDLEALKTPDLSPSDWKAATGQLVTWTSDGQVIEGMLYLPPGAHDTKSPLVTIVHGGPSDAFSDTHSNLVNLLIGEGWAVLQPNIRGSAGYGPAFMAGSKDDWGGRDLADILRGIDALISQYPIDPSRLALIGYSYGGEMAGFALGKTDRFKAIIEGGPVNDQFSEIGTEKGSGAFYDMRYIGNPWQHPEEALRQSPILYAKNATTPVLIVEGEQDANDPLGQAQELYRALKVMGKQADLVILPRESHQEAHKEWYGEASREPWNGVVVRGMMLDFLRRYLQ
jgi:dipeptidyl aminopeptidase/acylaminoacyl peptidase